MNDLEIPRCLKKPNRRREKNLKCVETVTIARLKSMIPAAHSRVYRTLSGRD